jgi:hypothetical protein
LSEESPEQPAANSAQAKRSEVRLHFRKILAGESAGPA